MSINVVSNNSGWIGSPSSWGRTFKSYFWDSRQKADGTSNLENAELTRLFRRLLSAGLATGGIGIATFATFGVVSWSVGLLAIPCALSSAGLNFYDNQVRDYESPYELEKLQNKASKLSLEEVIQIYGWSDMLRLGILGPDEFSNKYRMHLKGKSLNEVIHYYEKTLRHLSQCSSHKFSYQVPRPRESMSLWHKETAVLSCEQIFQSYPVEKLEKYSLVEHGELNCIKKLKVSYDAIKMQYDQKIAQIEQEFLTSTVGHKTAFEIESARIAQVYNTHAVVRELQGIEMHYTKERLKVQERQNQTISEAKVRFDNALIYAFGNNHPDYARLTPASKAIYDKHQREFQQAEALARQIAHQHIDQINRLRHERLQHLHTEEARVRQERIQSLAAAKSHYDASIGEFFQRKQAALQPIQSALSVTAGDCDSRYRAYLRMNAARR